MYQAAPNGVLLATSLYFHNIATTIPNALLKLGSNLEETPFVKKMYVEEWLFRLVIVLSYRGGRILAGAYGCTVKRAIKA